MKSEGDHVIEWTVETWAGSRKSKIKKSTMGCTITVRSEE